MVDGASVTHYVGSETLEVVGESYRQDNLWRAVGIPMTGKRVNCKTVAVLVPETGNQHDANAVAVWIKGLHVGYLCREDAASYRPGLERLAAAGPIALTATIVGGGYGDRVAILGVFLEHDPEDFGVSVGADQASMGELRTGLSQAFQTDRQDDSYDLGWYNDLPDDTRRAVAQLKSLLVSDPDLIDRHFMFSELEARLYRLRDVEIGALADYDATSAQHDAEMDRIRPALYAKFGAVPLLETYKQQCVRLRKAKDFDRGLWWAERGLALYGEDAGSQDWIDDLRKRAAIFRARLEAPATKPKRAAPDAVELARPRRPSRWRRPLTHRGGAILARRSRQTPPGRGDLGLAGAALAENDISGPPFGSLHRGSRFTIGAPCRGGWNARTNPTVWRPDGDFAEADIRDPNACASARAAAAGQRDSPRRRSTRRGRVHGPRRC